METGGLEMGHVIWLICGAYLTFSAVAAAKLLQSCLTLCDPTDGSPPGSVVPGILNKTTGVGCHFLLQCMKVKSESEVVQWSVRLFVTPWTTAYQAPPSMGFSRQEYWSGLPLPSLTFSTYSYIGRRGQKIRKLVIIDQVLTFLSYLHKVHGLASQVQLLQGL